MRALTIRTSRKSAPRRAVCLSACTTHACAGRYHLEQEDGFDHIIIVDGVPIIDESKKERLVTKIVKEFAKKGAPIKADDIFMPWEEAKDKSKGCAKPRSLLIFQNALTPAACRYMFIEFRNPDDAHFAQQAMDHFAFDKKHTFHINKFSDVDYFAELDETYEEPEPEEYRARVGSQVRTVRERR
jgi:translation initiation factor 3 subunit B